MQANGSKLPVESSDSIKNRRNSENIHLSIQNIKSGINMNLKTKIIIFSLVGVILGLIVAIVISVSKYSKAAKDYKNQISDLETEKRVLEYQISKLNNSILNLTDSNNNLNLTNTKLNNKLAKVSNDEVIRNKTYKTLEDISKEGVSLQTTFSAISKGIDKLTVNEKAKIYESSSTKEENTR